VSQDFVKRAFSGTVLAVGALLLAAKLPAALAALSQ
jgi:hypothetical protein